MLYPRYHHSFPGEFSMIRTALAFCLLIGLSASTFAGGMKGHDHASHKSDHQTSAAYEPEIVGMRVDDFQLLDHEGRAHQLYYYDDAPAVVIMTQGNGCPIVRNAVHSLKAVRDEYAADGVEFFLLNANLQDSRATIAEEAAEFGFDIPVLVDEHQLIAESLKVTRTAEIFVIDMTSKRVVYHGPVDDRVTYEVQKAKANHHYLADALDAVIDGKPVDVANVDAPGCIVNLPEMARRDEHANISYTDDIVPILERRCIECHQQGGIGPWAMSSYDMVRGFAPMIREVIRTDRMPPWNADPLIGEFHGDRSLEPQEVKTLVHWIEAGAPRGDGEDPLLAERHVAPEWPLGEPDLVLDIPAYDVPATGVVEYQRPAVEWPLEQGKWLRASTIKPGSRETVHHVLTGYMESMPEDGVGNESRWGASVGGYAVGAESITMPENIGTYIPPGGAIGFQMHYTPIGRGVTDASTIGLYFYDEPPELMMRGSVVIDFTIEIPPETARHQEVSYLHFPADAILYGAFPHAHYRGQSSSLAIRYPDGNEEMLLSLPNYDFNWQRFYEFKQPVDVPAGSKLIAYYEYDNSERNVANPDPSLNITWGDQSFEEMLFTAVRYRWKDESADNPTPQYQRILDRGRMFGMLDDNIDDMLQKDELKGRRAQRIARSFDRLDRNGDGGLTREEFAAVFVAQGDD